MITESTGRITYLWVSHFLWFGKQGKAKQMYYTKAAVRSLDFMRAVVSQWQLIQDTRLALRLEICELVILDLV